ncbi:hypothetical protein HY413_03410 [Candidatus Kaiserbacteria bacterium]|nr:hypothetical protein [Candidatus Kaiserbacteria bacterium]
MAKGLGVFVSGVYYGKYEKWVHAFVSFTLTLAGSVIFPPLSVAIAVACIGIVKEMVDALKPSDHFDLADLAANIGGIIAALFVLLMIAFVQIWRSPFLSD